MKSSVIIAIVFSFSLCLPTQAQNLKLEQTGQRHTKKGGVNAQYSINDTAVSQKKFDEFLKRLKEVDHTWYCAETGRGGRTGYDAKDSNGVVYEYKSVLDSNKSWNSLKIKTTLK